VKKIILFCFLFVFSFIVWSQTDSVKIVQNLDLEGFWKSFDDSPRTNRARIAFYNVENLFNTENDSLVSDEGYTPEGTSHWTKYRYWNKINKLSKVIVALGGWDYPEIVGLCEVENRRVVSDLIKSKSLIGGDYEIVHYDSPDNRGIDVALIYRKDRFRVLYSEPIRVTFPDEPNSKTRDVLYVNGLFPFSKDTLHIFVNHWPSRYGGYAATIVKRNRAADIVRAKVDSLYDVNVNARIFIMGDLNDYPSDESLIKHLRALPDGTNAQERDLINLMYPIHKEGKYGSHKYQDHWGILDQMIVSSALYGKSSGLRIYNQKAHIFRAPFLLEKDDTYLGYKVFRTYAGFRYLGGFADHLPVFSDLIDE